MLGTNFACAIKKQVYTQMQIESNPENFSSLPSALYTLTMTLWTLDEFWICTFFTKESSLETVTVTWGFSS
jgi:hypothetical protein